MIEDLHASYWPSFEGGYRAPNSAIEWLKKLIDVINVDHFEGDAAAIEDIGKLRELSRYIARITFFDSIAVIERNLVEKRRPYRRVIGGAEASIWNPFSAIAAGAAETAPNFVLSDTASKAMDSATLGQLDVERDKNQRLLEQLTAEREDNRALQMTLALRESDLSNMERRLSAEQEDKQALRASLADKDTRLGKLRSWLRWLGGLYRRLPLGQT